MSKALRLGGHLGLSSPERPLLAHLGRSPGPLDQIAALADHGFAGVQDLFLKLRPASERAAMAQLAAGRGLALTSFGGDPLHWNTPLWSSTDHDAVRDSVAANASLARQFGGAGAVVVAGYDDDRSRAVQTAQLIENLKRSAPLAEDAGLLLLVEPIASQRIPGMLLDQLEPAIEVVDAVGAPSVRLMFDIGHVAMMGHDVPAALRACARHVGLIQATDVAGRERVDPGLGTLDWPAVLGAVQAIGYAGVIELEYEPVDWSSQGETTMLACLAKIMGHPAP